MLLLRLPFHDLVCPSISSPWLFRVWPPRCQEMTFETDTHPSSSHQMSAVGGEKRLYHSFPANCHKYLFPGQGGKLPSSLPFLENSAPLCTSCATLDYLLNFS